MSGAEMYQGRRKGEHDTEILADGEPLKLSDSLKVVNHSPTGFEWGYAGSGPAQSALAILLDYTGKRNFAERFHQDFKFKYIAYAPKSGFLITSVQLDEFLRDTMAAELAAGRTPCRKCWCEIALHDPEDRLCYGKGCDCGKKDGRV